MEEYSGNRVLPNGTWARTVIGDRLLSPPPQLLPHIPSQKIQQSFVGVAANHGEGEILSGRRLDIPLR